MRVDCNILKDTLITHCMQFQSKLTGLLNMNGLQELSMIFDLFKKSKETLATLPNDLEDLSSKIALSKELKEQMASLQLKFTPIRDVYTTLSKFDVAIKDEERNMVNSLDEAFGEHVKMISDAEKLLDKSKINMKKELEAQMETHAALMGDLHKVIN